MFARLSRLDGILAVGLHVGQYEHRINVRRGQEFVYVPEILAAELLVFGDPFFGRAIP